MRVSAVAEALLLAQRLDNYPLPEPPRPTPAAKPSKLAKTREDTSGASASASSVAAFGQPGTDGFWARNCLLAPDSLAGAHYHSESQASQFLQQIPGLVASMSDCDVVLYQAGADPHIDDPLGGWLTTQQLARRSAVSLLTE